MGYAQVLLHALIRTRRDFGGRGFSHRVTPGQAAWCAWAALAVRQAPGASCNTLGAKAHTKVDTEGGQDAWGRTFDATRGERRGGGKKDGDEPCWSLGVGDRFPATKDARAQLALGDINAAYANIDHARLSRAERCDSAVSAALGRIALRCSDVAAAYQVPDWETAPDARGQKSWDGVLQWIRSLDDRMDARLVGFGESEARAVNDCEERAVALTAARAAATRGAVKRWRRVRAAFAIGQDAKMSAAMAAGTVAAVARACRGDPSDTAEPVDEAWAAARRRERTCFDDLLDLVSRTLADRDVRAALEVGETPKAWARATRHASDVRGDAYSRLDGDERSAAEAVPKLNDWLGHLRKVRAQFRAWPRGGPPEVAWAPGLFRPTAFFAQIRGHAPVLVASSGLGGVRVSGLDLSGGAFDNDMMTLRDGASRPVTLRVRGGDEEDGYDLPVYTAATRGELCATLRVRTTCPDDLALRGCALVVSL